MAKMLIVVDAQKDFVKGGCLAYGYPQEDITQKVIDYARQWVGKEETSEDGSKFYQRDWDSNNILIVTKDTHGPNYASTMEGQKLPVPHCIKGTPGWELVDDASDEYGLGYIADTQIFKPTFGTFQIADLIKEYEEDQCEEVDEIQICGFDTSICVLANAVILRAAFPNKKIVLLEKLCGDVNQDCHNAAVAVLRNQQIDIA